MFSSILGLENAHAPLLWKVSEDYLSCRHTALRYDHFDGKKIVVLSARDDRPFIWRALKIASYTTVVLPLLALIVRSFYRSKYAFEVMKASSEGPTAKVTGVAKSSFKTKVNNNSAVIEKISAARKRGLKVALFVGRGDNQAVPAQKNWLWVSLDETMINPSNKKRPHLQMDFNDKKQMDRLKNLCDKVVVDWSVLKFMRTPWLTIRDLLVADKDSEATVEAFGGITYFDKSIVKPQYHPEEGYMVLPPGIWGDPPIANPAARQAAALEGLYEATENHLKNLFDKVHLHYNTKYPYRSPDEEQRLDFWVLKSPKKIPLSKRKSDL